MINKFYEKKASSNNVSWIEMTDLSFISNGLFFHGSFYKFNGAMGYHFPSLLTYLHCLGDVNLEAYLFLVNPSLNFVNISFPSCMSMWPKKIVKVTEISILAESLKQILIVMRFF